MDAVNSSAALARPPPQFSRGSHLPRVYVSVNLQSASIPAAELSLKKPLRPLAIPQVDIPLPEV